MIIFSAPWIVPIDKPVIADGALVIEDDRIVAIGHRSDITGRYPFLKEVSCRAVLMPGLVNGHMHLELSHLEKAIDCPPDTKFTSWVSRLLKRQLESPPSRQQLIDSYINSLENQLKSGVALVCDIGNDPLQELQNTFLDSKDEIVRLQEFIAPNRTVAGEVIEKIGQVSDGVRVTAHAPYSTGPDVLVTIKKRCNLLGHTFSIHTAESPDEGGFIRNGRGIFRNFLEQRGSWDGLFPFARRGFSSTIEYFDHLGILDENTLLVHCVHVSKRDIDVVVKRGAKVCLCPGSNRYLGVGLPPVESMLDLGLLPCLGTDSIGSNEVLDMWREMQLLAASYPTISHDKILAMATEGGAMALGLYEKYGSLTVGKKARIIHVLSEELMSCKTETELMKELVMGGQPTEVTWLKNKHTSMSN